MARGKKEAIRPNVVVECNQGHWWVVRKRPENGLVRGESVIQPGETYDAPIEDLKGIEGVRRR